jgi:hypothetical protein
MSELKPTTEESIRHFEAKQKRYVREHGGKPCPHYANAIEALHRAQPANEPCADCSGMVYRQTASGKIIPADAKCAVIEPPPCYQPDNDGCAYQIYGDNDDEPIDKCKACPLCYSDKVRHNANEPLPDHIGDVTEMVPLTLEQLKQMDGEPVWCADGEGHSCYCLVNAESEDCIDSECGAWCFEFYGMTGDGENGLHNMGWLAYDHKLGGEQE